MGRRRKVIDDDGDSSEGERPGEGDEDLSAYGISNADLAEEAALFANPYSRKKRRTKDDAIYGVFGDEEDEKDDARGGRGRRYMSGVRFVSGNEASRPDAEQPAEYNSSDREAEDGDDGGAMESNTVDAMDVDDDGVDRPGLGSGPSKMQESDDEDADVRPHFGMGLGYGKGGREEEDEHGAGPPRPSFGGVGLGFGATGRGGLGFSSTPDEFPTDMPTSFGPQKAKGKGRKNTTSSPSGSVPRVDKSFGTFEKSTKGIGSKLLEKMGWKKGMGLGKEGTGIAAPIDVKLRPKGAGLGLVDERTEAVKREQREKAGEEMDEDEAYGGTKPKVEPRTGQWKRSARKKKVAYKSAQELIAEQEGGAAPAVSAAQATKILDMTGREVRELSHISEAATATAAFEVTAARLPELRHNVGLLADMAQQELLHLSRQARIEKTRQEQLRKQHEVISAQAEEENRRSVRLKAVVELANECQQYSQQFAYTLGEINMDALIKAFTGPFTKLQQEHQEEYQLYGLDELVVAALAPIMKKMLASWEPLQDPTFGADAFRQWKKLLMTPTQRSKKQSDRMVIDGDEDANRKMTPYESMMYNIWLPKVRQAVNNDWDPKHPDPVIALLEAWHAPQQHRYHRSEEKTADSDSSVLLPSWLYHNILEQLILPKLTREVQDWNPSRDPVLVHTWIHPWLPHLADRMDSIFITIRHKLDVSWRKWEGRDQGPLVILTPWKEVFKPSDMESLIVKAILPKLVLILQRDFVVNPRAQDLQPLINVFAWRDLVPTHLMVHLLETEFFPKWHRILWAWLSSPGASGEEITQWYKSWKNVFPPELAKETGIVNQFRAGLDMMNQSMAMGGAKGPMPAPPRPIAELSQTAAAGGKVSSANGSRRLKSSTAMSAMDAFKDYVERTASEHDLLFAPANRVHPVTGKALFRLAPAAKAASGVGGLVGYIDEGVIFVEDGSGGWSPVGVEEAMQLAKGKKGGRGR